MLAELQKYQIQFVVFAIVGFFTLIPTKLTGQSEKYDDPKHPADLNFESYNIVASSSTYVRTLKKDKGVIWALTFDHLYKFSSGNFYKVLDLKQDESEEKPDEILLDKQSRIWLSYSKSPNQLQIFDIRSATVSSAFEHGNISKYSDEIKSSQGAYNDYENNIWWKLSETEFLKFSTDFETIKVNSKENVIKLFQFDETIFAHTSSGLHYLKGNSLVPFISVDATNITINQSLKSSYTVYAENTKNSTIDIFLIQDNQVEKKISRSFTDFKYINDQYLYHETTNCLVRAHQSQFFVENHNTRKEYNIRIPFYPTSNSIYDDYGNIYLPTTNGIITITKKKYPFEILNKNQTNSYRHLQLVRDSILQCATYSGYEVINLNTGATISKYPEIISYSRTDIDSTTSILNKSGTKQLITQCSGKENIESIKIGTAFNAAIGSYIDETIRKIYYDRQDSTLWVAGLSSLWKSKISKGIPQTKIIDNIRKVTEITKHNGNIIVSTDEGLYKLNKDGSHEQIDLKTNKLFCNILEVSNENELFVTVQGDGIKVLDEDYTIIDHYDSKIGVKPANIYSLELDNDNNIWAGTSYGILYLDRQARISNYYTYTDGIGQNDFNYQSSHKIGDGTMFFGGTDRLVKFHPDSILAADKHLKIKLVDAFTRTRKQNKFTSLFDKNKLTLTANNPEVKLVFGYENLKDKSQDDILYQLDDQEWMELKNDELLLKELSTGTHQIKVKHKYNNEDMLTSTIKSRYPLPGYLAEWLTALFITLSLIYLSILVKGKRLEATNLKLEKQVALRTKEINETNKHLEKSNDTKDKIFSVLAHDLRSPINNLIDLTETVNFLIERNRVEDLLVVGKEIQHKTNRLKTMIDNVLHWSIQQQNKTYFVPNKFKIIGPISNTINLFKTTANEKDISFDLDVAADTSITTDHATFELIIRNLIHNAIKYSYSGGIIKIFSESVDNQIRIIIEDNGIGISKEQLSAIKHGNHQSTTGPYNEKGIGIGLTLSIHFAKMMKGNILIENKKSKGTRVTLSLPVTAPQNLLPPENT